MHYGEILNNAWKIIWKHKILWIFGFLASCGARQGSSFDFRSQTSNASSIRDFSPELENWIDQAAQAFQQNLWYIGLIIFIFLLVGLLFFILNTIGTAGSIRGPWLVETGAERLTFGELWENSLGYFWRIFLLSLTTGFATWAPIIIVTMLAVLGFQSANINTALTCVGISVCLVFIPYLWLVQVWFNQAMIAAVGENLSFSESISQGWNLVTKNLGTYIVMSLILGIVAGVVGFTFSLPLLVILAPIFPALLNGGVQNTGSALTTALIAGLCYSPVLMIGNSILVAYVNSAWTVTYRQVCRRLGLLNEPAEALQPGLGPV
jgi:hypothetical protein